MTHDASSTSNKHPQFGEAGGASQYYREGAFSGINQANQDAHKRAKLTEGVLGSHVPVAELADIHSAQNASGQIGRGNGTEQIPKRDYEPGQTSLPGAGRGTRTHKDCSGGF